MCVWWELWVQSGFNSVCTFNKKQWEGPRGTVFESKDYLKIAPHTHPPKEGLYIQTRNVTSNDRWKQFAQPKRTRDAKWPHISTRMDKKALLMNKSAFKMWSVRDHSSWRWGGAAAPATACHHRPKGLEQLKGPLLVQPAGTGAIVVMVLSSTRERWFQLFWRCFCSVVASLFLRSSPKAPRIRRNTNDSDERMW